LCLASFGGSVRSSGPGKNPGRIIETDTPSAGYNMDVTLTTTTCLESRAVRNAPPYHRIGGASYCQFRTSGKSLAICLANYRVSQADPWSLVQLWLHSFRGASFHPRRSSIPMLVDDTLLSAIQLSFIMVLRGESDAGGKWASIPEHV
jgi:hypothetical protein